MFSFADISYIRDTVFKKVGFTFDGSIAVEEFDGVRVFLKDGNAVIGCSTKPQLARCFFLLAMEASSGRDEFEIEQKPCFDELGVMLSMQAPLKVDFVINYMECMACLGYTYILLYMETSYEVKGYPFFGYMRGRYTADDLAKIESAGQRLGIECIPCIQTFGHLSDFLRWPAAGALKDSPECLLADYDDTYKFIESCIATMRSIFKSDRIHIGFDETRGMGLGRYLINHDYPDRNELFCRHLVKVKEICRKYDYKPMMWSDMPFRLGGDGHSDEYDEKSVIPKIVSEAADGVAMCFWDYYNREYEPYDRCLKRHKEIFPDSEIVFSGGVWILDNQVMNMPHTLNASIPALMACIDNDIRNINATIWGNASNTSMEQSIPGLPVFSEFCYIGRDCSKADIYKAAQYLTKMTRRFIEAVSEFHLGYKNSLKLGARFLWTDVLYGLMRFDADCNDAKVRFENALKIIREESLDGDPLFKEFCEKLFEAVIIKAEILGGIRDAYRKNNTEFIAMVADELIPQLIPVYERLGELKTELWMRSTTPFGVENVQFEFADMLVRLRFSKTRLDDYLDGRIDRIQELEQEILDEGYIDWLGAYTHMKAYNS